MGLNEAATFLVLACGSGGDNETSSWSAEAAATRLHMRWRTADTALKNLITHKLVRKVKGGPRPTYKLKKRGDLIWLPNTLVDGAADEPSPAARVRQTQDPMCLRLLVELYAAQNLREDGGISTSVTYQSYERERIGQRGEYVVWSFTNGGSWVTWGPVTLPHHRHEDDLTEEERAEGKNPGVDFFCRFGLLVSLGLVQWVPYLFEGPEGEPIHPVWKESDVPEERQLAEACERTALNCLTEAQTEYLDDYPGDILAAVSAHVEQVTVIGVARLRYRPWTAMTAAWRARTLAQQQYTERYDAVTARISAAPASSDS
jgi:hypothetical protein